MADVDEETIEEIFNAELERLQAAMEELDEASLKNPKPLETPSKSRHLKRRHP